MTSQDGNIAQSGRLPAEGTHYISGLLMPIESNRTKANDTTNSQDNACLKHQEGL